jgi:hypothetical protein
MTIVVFTFLGLIAEAGVRLYSGWGVIPLIAGSLFNPIPAMGLAGLSIASARCAHRGGRADHRSTCHVPRRALASARPD